MPRTNLTDGKTPERKTKERGNGQGTVWKKGGMYRRQVTLGYRTGGKRTTRAA